MAVERKGVTKFVGATLSVRRKTYQIMSDVWEDCNEAISWDSEAKNIVREPMWEGSAIADATPEVIQEVYQFFYEIAVKKLRARVVDSSTVPEKGRLVRVAGGRTSKGAVGRVFWLKEADYNMGYTTAVRLKAGIALNDEKHTVEKNGRTYESFKNVIWVWAHNLEVVDPETYQDFSEVESRARSEAVVRLSEMGVKYEAL